MEKVDNKLKFLIAIRFLWNTFSGVVASLYSFYIFVVMMFLHDEKDVAIFNILAFICVICLLLYITIGVVAAVCTKRYLKCVDESNFQFVFILFNLVVLTILLVLTVCVIFLILGRII